MTRERTRHFLMPAAISGFMDRLAGRRHGRNLSTADAKTDRAMLERQKVALARTAGILKNVDIPGWETPERTSAWVHKLREADSQATEDKLSSHPTP